MNEAQKEEILSAVKEKRSGIRADLSGANLFDADLSGAELLGADLSGSDLTGANLAGADLTKANLRDARLWHTDLSGAKLVEADLSHADLWQTNLSNSRLWRTDITGVKSLSRQNFFYRKNRFISGYRIYEKGHITAEETYRNLKRFFLQAGRYNDASWASFKEKTMEKLRLRKQRRFSYIPIAVMGFLCGYGEKPHRIITSSALIMFAYAVLFYLLKSVKVAAANGFSLNFGDYIYYSVVTFTTLGYGDIIPKMSTLYRLLAVSEAFLGAFMMGLFVFTLARRYSAR